MTESTGAIALGPGVCVGSYILNTKLARGGFGDIWEAIHRETQKQVAIKILHAELVLSEVAVLRFEQEARAMAMARHPNVIELYDVGKLADNRPYMIMELLTGTNLESHIHTHGALPPQRVMTILAPLCSALSSAHKRGIIHRDVKASNVVLSRRDSAERVVLLDFGIAKLLEVKSPQLTGSRMTLGSPVCMAPEQIQGKPVDPRTDVYALGSLTFFMLAGEEPFPGRSVDAMHQHLMAPRPRPSDRVDISPVLDSVVVTAMAKNPDERYSSAAEFLAAYRTALEAAEKTPAPRQKSASRNGAEHFSAPCIGLYLDVRAGDEALADPDEELLDDMDSIFPRAARFLEDRGFVLAYESGDSALFVMPLPAQDTEHQDARARSITHARELLSLLDNRDGRHPAVRVAIQLHVAQATLTRGLVTEGPLLDISSWVTPMAHEGIAATPEMLDGLDTIEQITM